MSELQEQMLQTIITRRSTRKFTPDKIDEATLEKLLQAALFAPTGGNHQETRFLVIDKEETLAKLTTLVREIFAARPLDPTDYQNKTAIVARKPHYDFRYHAPLVIACVAPKAHGNAMADSALALENLMIAANALGVGTCYVNQLHWLTDDPQIHPELLALGMQEDEACFGSVICGCPQEGLMTNLPPRKEGRIVRQ